MELGFTKTLPNGGAIFLQNSLARSWLAKYSTIIISTRIAPNTTALFAWFNRGAIRSQILSLSLLSPGRYFAKAFNKNT